jgi:electron transfer flavoprotein beta subunit
VGLGSNSDLANEKWREKMDIIVCVKQIVDLQQIRIKKETKEPVLEGLPLIFGDMDKSALEEAVRIKEKHEAKVIVLSLGSSKLNDTIIEALAIGADEAVILTDPLFGGLDSSGTAEVLAKAIQKIGRYDLVLLGDGSTDNNSGQVGSRLAEILDLPQITYVRELEVDGNMAKAVRDVEECFEVVEVDFPVVITVASEINEPRIPPISQILRASGKPLQDWKSPDLGISADELGKERRLIEVISNLAQEQERKGIISDKIDEGVDNLVSSLTKEGVLGR